MRLKLKQCDMDVDAGLNLHIWSSDSPLGLNSFRMKLSQKELEDVCHYFRYAAGELRASDSDVADMQERGVLLFEENARYCKVLFAERYGPHVKHSLYQCDLDVKAGDLVAVPAKGAVARALVCEVLNDLPADFPHEKGEIKHVIGVERDVLEDKPAMKFLHTMVADYKDGNLSKEQFYESLKRFLNKSYIWLDDEYTAKFIMDEKINHMLSANLEKILELQSFAEKTKAEDCLNLSAKSGVRYTEPAVDLMRAISTFENENPEFGRLLDYQKVLERRGIRYNTEAMKKANIEVLDLPGVIALFSGMVHGERIRERSMGEFLVSGAVAKWMHRLRELQEAL